MKKEDINIKVIEKVECRDSKEDKIDKYGNFIIGIDIEDDVIFILFKNYMNEKNYSLVSKQHCEILDEEGKGLKEVISSTVINEIMYKVISKEVERRKEELLDESIEEKNDSDS